MGVHNVPIKPAIDQCYEITGDYSKITIDYTVTAPETSTDASYDRGSALHNFHVSRFQRYRNQAPQDIESL